MKDYYRAQGFWVTEGSKTDCGNGCTTLNILKTTEFYALNGWTVCKLYLNKVVENKNNGKLVIMSNSNPRELLQNILREGRGGQLSQRLLTVTIRKWLVSRQKLTKRMHEVEEQHEDKVIHSTQWKWWGPPTSGIALLSKMPPSPDVICILEPDPVNMPPTPPAPPTLS